MRKLLARQIDFNDFTFFDYISKKQAAAYGKMSQQAAKLYSRRAG